MLVAASAATSTAALLGDAKAALLALDPGNVVQTVEVGNVGFIDVDTDGINDFRIAVVETSGADGVDEVASITGLDRLPRQGLVSPGEITQISQVFVKDAIAPGADGQRFLERFKPGQKVFTDETGYGGEFSSFLVEEGSPSRLSNKGVFYAASGPDGDVGPFKDVDDVGYIGLVVDILSASIAAGGVDADAVNRQVIAETDLIDQEFIPIGTRTFAWLEVSRGSINVISGARQTISNAAALIPNPQAVDVPEPASLPLMALGAAGLIALRRQKAA